MILSTLSLFSNTFLRNAKKRPRSLATSASNKKIIIPRPTAPIAVDDTLASGAEVFCRTEADKDVTLTASLRLSSFNFSFKTSIVIFIDLAQTHEHVLLLPIVETGKSFVAVVGSVVFVVDGGSSGVE